MKIPSFYRIKEATKDRNTFPLHHEHLTTTDFFRIQPVLARELVAKDKITAKVESFVRLFPMPYPTYGRIKYYNRFFFVPNRMLMEGWNSFITDAPYPTQDGNVKIASVPYFVNSDVASLFASSESGLSVEVLDGFYVRELQVFSNTRKILVDSAGRAVTYTGTVYGATRTVLFSYMTIIYDGVESSGWYMTYTTNNDGAFIVSQCGSVDCGTITEQSDAHLVYVINDTRFASSSPYYEFSWTRISGQIPGEFDAFTVDGLPDYSSVVGDFHDRYSWRRFSNKGRIFYNLLISLGYRVDFRRNLLDGFNNHSRRSALKLLAYVKVYLDYYRPSNYESVDYLERLFYGVDTNGGGRRITSEDLSHIADIIFSSYEHDYFTSAWDKPNAPNGNNVYDSSLTMPDINRQSDDVDYSIVRNAPEGASMYEGTPYVHGHLASGIESNSPSNLTKYILDALSSLQDFLHRNQLSGFRAIDRYLARYGVKLTDDRANRAYYLGSNEYTAMISDVMSTAETAEGRLGDYAGKGIAYSDNQKSIHFESNEEFGIFLIISTVVPSVGYVQGNMRENMHLKLTDFFQPEFDNLGVQAIRQDEIFGDSGMYNIDKSAAYPHVYNPDRVFGFSPRYSEYKVGYCFRTGDFAIPSRSQGLNAYHMFRMFDSDEIDHDIDFCVGEQEQYDRIFNNTDADYDHMNVYHVIDIQATRPMKSIAEAIDFEDGGRSIDIAAEGTQLS